MDEKREAPSIEIENVSDKDDKEPENKDKKREFEKKRPRIPKRFSFLEVPSQPSTDRPRFHSQTEERKLTIQHNTLATHNSATNVFTIEMPERKQSRKPTSYYEVYPLPAYENKEEKKKRRMQIPVHDPRYRETLRERFLYRKYTIIAVAIGGSVLLCMGVMIVLQSIGDFS